MSVEYVSRKFIALGQVRYVFLNSISLNSGIKKEYYKCESCQARIHVYTDLNKFELKSDHGKPKCSKAHQDYLEEFFANNERLPLDETIWENSSNASPCRSILNQTISILDQTTNSMLPLGLIASSTVILDDTLECSSLFGVDSTANLTLVEDDSIANFTLVEDDTAENSNLTTDNTAENSNLTTDNTAGHSTSMEYSMISCMLEDTSTDSSFFDYTNSNYSMDSNCYTDLDEAFLCDSLSFIEK